MDDMMQRLIDHESRVSKIEEAVDRLSIAAEHQIEFNKKVLAFMSSAMTWGKAGILVYGLGQAIVVGIIVSKLS